MLNNHKNPFISIIFYCFSIFVFLTAQLSIVSGMSGRVFSYISYHYPLRAAMNCLAIAFAILAVVFGKTNRRITAIRILLSAAIIIFILVFGMRINYMAL